MDTLALQLVRQARGLRLHRRVQRQSRLAHKFGFDASSRQATFRMAPPWLATNASRVINVSGSTSA